MEPSGRYCVSWRHSSEREAFITDIEIERLEDAARRVFGGAGFDAESEPVDHDNWLGRALKDFWPVRGKNDLAGYEHRAGSSIA